MSVRSSVEDEGPAGEPDGSASSAGLRPADPDEQRCPKTFNRSAPPVTVVPVLTYPDVRAAVDWLGTAFGFVERVRIGESHRSQLSIGPDGAVIVTDDGADRRPPQEGAVTHLLKVRVPDVDAAFERARAAGARVVEPPTDREYGEREATVADLAGHRWQFTQTLRDVAPEEFGCTTVEPWQPRGS